MKKFAVLGAVAALAMATPAMASDFVGPRVEATVGYDDVVNLKDTTDVVYGGAVGYDFEVTDKVRFGVEGGVENPFENRTFNAAARLGYVVSPKALVYAKAGYTNIEAFNGVKLDGLRVGGGLELKVAGPVAVKAEYRYSDVASNAGSHAVTTGLVIRF